MLVETDSEALAEIDSLDSEALVDAETESLSDFEVNSDTDAD